MLIYIIIIIDFTIVGVMRIGAGSLGEEWNANTIGMNLALGAFSIFILLKEKSNKVRKMTYLL